MGAWGFVKNRIVNAMKDAGVKQNTIHYIGRSPSAPPATGIANRHKINQKNIISLALEANISEIIKSWAGVSQIRGKLPIE